MSAERDVNRIVRSWLGEDEYESADAILGIVLSRLDTTPQRRSWWPARRFAPMNTYAKVAVAAAAVILIAFVGYNLLPRAPGYGGQPSVPPTAEPTATASSISPLNGQSPLAAGRYLANAGPGLYVTVAVSATGWAASGDWVVWGPQGNQAPSGMAIRFYSIDNLAKDPLSFAAGKVTPPIGPTVDDLVQAIVAHPAWEASTPTDVTIGGHPGKLVTITIPSDVVLGSDSKFYLSVDEGPDPGGIWGWSPGQAFDWYILDVDGKRLIIDAFHFPGTTAADLAAQRAVVQSVEAKTIP